MAEKKTDPVEVETKTETGTSGMEPGAMKVAEIPARFLIAEDAERVRVTKRVKGEKVEVLSMALEYKDELVVPLTQILDAITKGRNFTVKVGE